MAVESRVNNTNYPFVLSGESMTSEAETILQDAVRATVLAKYTLMAQVPATRKWVPFTDETLSNGQEFPLGIIMASLTAAQMVAGDVLDIPILTGGCFTFDENQLVIENSKTLNTVISTLNLTVRQWLHTRGMYPEDTDSIDEFENV
jgi:hypothetical protein